MDHHLLPPEIWHEILRWATTSDTDCNPITASYTPFRPASYEVEAPDRVMNVKAKIVLVCHQWRELAAGLLYEDLRVFRGTHALLHALSHQHANYSKLVRRLVLPYQTTVTPYQTTAHFALQILKLCTNLETLVRPREAFLDVQFHFEAEAFPLASLRRLDWWYYNEAERSGGINSLAVVLRGAPNIQYLSVGGIVGHHILSEGLPLTLFNLHTLRLHGSIGLFLHKLATHWSLPVLTNVIVDSPLAQMGLSHIWDIFGSQLRTVEFGKHVRFLLDDHITACLRGCPNLTELNFYLFFTMIPSPQELRHHSLATIGLHAAVNQLLHDGTAICDHIEKHFHMFTSNNFASIHRIILYGEWRGILSHPRLAQMWQSVRDRSIEVVLS